MLRRDFEAFQFIENSMQGDITLTFRAARFFSDENIFLK
jgi:hypothetical protein